MAVFLPILSNFGVHICVLVAIITGSYLWVKKHWESSDEKKRKFLDIDDETAEFAEKKDSDEEEEVVHFLTASYSTLNALALKGYPKILFLNQIFFDAGL